MAESFHATDPFAALGLTRDAFPLAIKKRYHELARRYHPNRYHAAATTSSSPTKLLANWSNGDNSIISLSEHFSRINEAYTLLSKESQRKRYIQWSALEERNATLDDHRRYLENVDLYGESSSDESSSDLEVFDDADALRNKRGRSHGKEDNPAIWLEDHHHKDTARQAAVERRKKLTRLKRKELSLFEDYREAKLAEMNAQSESERLEDLYVRAKAKREKFEQVPRTSTRMRMVWNIWKATRVLNSLKVVEKDKALDLRPPSPNDIAINAHDVGVRVTSAKPTRKSSLILHQHGFDGMNGGDQTESDEDSTQLLLRERGRRYRSQSPLPRRPVSRDATPQPQAAQLLKDNEIFSPYQNSTIISVLSDYDDAPDPKFTLVVKRPTGFDGYSSDEANTPTMTPYTARSRTPPPPNTCLDLIHLSNGIGATRHWGENDMAADNTLSDGYNESGSEPSPVRGSIFKIKSIEDVYFPTSIPADHVHTLDLNEEYRLLGAPSDIDTDPESLLTQMTAWDDSLGRQFMVKPDIKASFAFRLICDNKLSHDQAHHSFIALSYRRKKTVEKVDGQYSRPLSAEMMQAVWEERASEDEGLWVDQICIKQDDKRERDISMSAMDLVYRGARLVVVVLDDHEFTGEEAKVLLEHMREYAKMKSVAAHRRFRRRSPPYLVTNDVLRGIVRKILSASWFRRAWCRHEMRLARDLVFLLPCQSYLNPGKSVIRLRSSCLAHLLALASEISFAETAIERVKPALLAFFNATPSASHHYGYDKHLQHGNFTSVAADIFRMEAGGDPRLPRERQKSDARWDRMSIILNTMECGLALRPLPDNSRRNLSEADCYYSLLMLALAARDPGALCSAGRPLHIMSPSGSNMSSWLFEPSFDDSMQQQQQACKRLSLGSSISSGMTGGDHWINLDLKLVSDDLVTKRQTAANVPDFMHLARTFFERCKERNWGVERYTWLLQNRELTTEFGSMEDISIETLAGVFCCGPEWMSDITHRFGFSKWKRDLQPAYWLMVNLCSMNGHWPGNNWTAAAASFIMNFVYSLVIRGLPHKQLHRRPEFWRPVWLTLRNRGKVLVFAPTGGAEVYHVVPGVLLDTSYRDLKRLWALAKRDDHPGHWALLGKSCLFADDLATEIINVRDDQFRTSQTVHGQSAP